VSSDLLARLRQQLGAAYAVQRELGGGNETSRFFLATETVRGQRVVIQVRRSSVEGPQLEFSAIPYSDSLMLELKLTPVTGGTGLSRRDLSMGASTVRRHTAAYVTASALVVLIAGAIIFRAPEPDRTRLENTRRLEERVRERESARDLPGAEAAARDLIAADPAAPSGWSLLGGVLLAEHRNDSAIADLRRAVALEGAHPSAPDLAYLSYAFAVSGQRDSALALQRTLEADAAREAVSPAALAIAELGAGDRDSAIALFSRAIDEHDPYMGQIFPEDPVFDALRADPRFDALKRRAHLS
jgi:tetratricopeptide (TPR) repeat protein